MASFIKKLFQKNKPQENKDILNLIESITPASTELEKIILTLIPQDKLLDTLSVLAGYSCQFALTTVLNANNVKEFDAYVSIGTAKNGTPLIDCDDLNKPLILDVYSVWNILNKGIKNSEINVQSTLQQCHQEITSGHVDCSQYLETIGDLWKQCYFFVQMVNGNPISWPMVFAVTLLKVINALKPSVNRNEVLNHVLRTAFLASKMQIKMKVSEDSIVCYPKGIPDFSIKATDDQEIPNQILIEHINKEKENNPFIASQLIYKDVDQHIKSVLNNTKGVHAETLLAVTGALAGYVIQRSVAEIYQRDGYIRALLPFLEFKTTNEALFFAGDNINAFLAESKYSLWSFIAQPIQEKGEKLPDINEYFKYSVECIGDDNYGVFPLPDNHPIHGNVLDYVLPLWKQLEPKVLQYCPNPEERPIVFALVAQALIKETESMFSGELQLKLILQSAILASKYDFSTKEAAKV